MRTHGRHRAALAPSLENLEGRRLLAANPGAVRIQEITSGTSVELLIVGTKQADVVNITDNGSATAGNVSVTLGNGTTYTSKGAVTAIQVAGKQGNDQVTYNLTGDLVAARTVNVDLSTGNDQFTANVSGTIRTTSLLDLEAYGGAGNDTLAINQTGATLAGTFFPYLEGDNGNDVLSFTSTGNISTSAVVGPALVGGNGSDTIALGYAGQVNGQLFHNSTVDGGAGNDHISVNGSVTAGSTGQVGASAAAPALVDGGAGNDQVHYDLLVDPTVTLGQTNAAVVGGNGMDSIQRSPNVKSDASDENDALLAT